MQQYFTEQAHNYDEAIRKAQAKYGERLKIFFHETVKIPGGFLGLFHTEGVKIMGFVPRVAPLSREQMEQQALLRNDSPVTKPDPGYFYKESQRESQDFAEEKKKILNTLGARDQKDVMAEIKAIKDKLESLNLTDSREEHSTLNRLEDILILNDFSLPFRKSLLERVRKDFSPNELENYDKVQDKVLEWIGESIKISENDNFNIRPRIMILIGPTGVGKTTTVAKLAANFGINYKEGKQKRRVALVTIDGYRIGAFEQLDGYGNVMNYPCFSAGDHDELKALIALNSENTDLILVDTIGKSPRDFAQLGEMKHFLDACGTMAEVHLVVSATTKSSDITEILKTFEPFNYKSIIVTKIDETIRTGNVISALSDKAKSVSYITNGQKVPTDINKASVIQFLTNLEGFKVNMNMLQEKFPGKKQEHMQQWR